MSDLSLEMLAISYQGKKYTYTLGLTLAKPLYYKEKFYDTAQKVIEYRSLTPRALAYNKINVMGGTIRDYSDAIDYVYAGERLMKIYNKRYNEAVERLTGLYKYLTKEEADVIHMIYIDDVETKEVPEALSKYYDTDLATVRQHHRKALHKLDRAIRSVEILKN